MATSQEIYQELRECWEKEAHRKAHPTSVLSQEQKELLIRGVKDYAEDHPRERSLQELSPVLQRKIQNEEPLDATDLYILEYATARKFISYEDCSYFRKVLSVRW